jgi:hypothetical protein
MRKSLLIALTASILLAAVPALAQEFDSDFEGNGWEYIGTWTGTGGGFCYPYEELIIYPFQTWKADLKKHTVIDYYGIRGTWVDEKGNTGEFGCGLFPQPDGSLQMENSGFWTWYESEDNEILAGQLPFIIIHLEQEDGYTYGYWNPSYTHWPPDEDGKFEGYREW